MTERANLVSLFKAVDDEVQLRSDEVLDPLARLLPQYEGGGAAGWFARYAEYDPSFAVDIVDVDAALESMLEDGLEPSLSGQRLLALAAFARVDPRRDDRRSSLAAALKVLLPEDAQATEREFELLDLVINPEVKWNDLVLEAEAVGLLSAAVVARAIDCCQDGWANVTVGGSVYEASILTTSFVTDRVTIARLRNYLQPGNWPVCAPSSLWCTMNLLTPPGASPAHYLEVIRLRCHPPPGAWSLTTCLAFVSRDLPGGAISLDYQLCGDSSHAHHTDRRVTVDEGSITACVVPGSAAPAPGANPPVRVVTTKRVAFRDFQFDAPQFAMWACALGYGEAAKSMALDCAADENKKEPTDPWHPHQPDHAGPVWGQFEHFIDHAAHTVADGLKDCGAAAQASLAKIAAGPYTIDDLAADTTAMWARAARDMLRLVGPWLPVPPGAFKPRAATSIQFEAGTRGWPRDVRLAAPMENAFRDSIPLAVTRMVPTTIGSGDGGGFRVEADVVDGVHAGVYWGRAVLTERPSGANTVGQSQTIDVWLQVS